MSDHKKNQFCQWQQKVAFLGKSWAICNSEAAEAVQQQRILSQIWHKAATKGVPIGVQDDRVAAGLNLSDNSFLRHGLHVMLSVAIYTCPESLPRKVQLLPEPQSLCCGPILPAIAPAALAAESIAGSQLTFPVPASPLYHLPFSSLILSYPWRGTSGVSISSALSFVNPKSYTLQMSHHPATSGCTFYLPHAAYHGH